MINNVLIAIKKYLHNLMLVIVYVSGRTWLSGINPHETFISLDSSVGRALVQDLG